jgi:hypothetical protein
LQVISKVLDQGNKICSEVLSGMSC